MQADGEDGHASEVEQNCHDALPIEKYRRLVKILHTTSSQSKTNSSLSAPENEEVVQELEDLLSRQSSTGLLKNGEALLRSSLQVARSLSSSGDDAFTRYQELVEQHLEMTYSCNGSAVNVNAFLLYTSLLLTLHYAYVRAQPREDELTLVAGAENDSHQDVAAQWTHLVGAPRLLSGRYTQESLSNYDLFDSATSSSSHTAEEWERLLGVEAVRIRLREAYSRIAGDASQSQQAWSLYHQFEVTHLPSSPSPKQLDTVQSLYQARLRAPHSQVEQTLQSYSTFVSKYLPPSDYENALTTVYKLVSPAKETWSSMEPYEMQLGHNGRGQGESISQRWAVWKSYLSWISRAFLHSNQKKSSFKLRLDVEGVCAVYERAIASCGLPPSCVEELYSSEDRPASRQELMTLRGNSGESKEVRKQREEAQLKADEEASLDLWKRYLAFLGSSKASSSITMDVCTRAAKAVPFSGELHGKILRIFCRLRRSKTQIDEYFGTALGQLSGVSPATAIIDLLLAWLDVQRESAASKVLVKGGAKDLSEAVGLLAQDQDAFMEVYGMMTFAMGILEERSIVDELLRIEQVISEWCLRGGEETAALAETVWDKATHVQSSNSLVWLAASRFYRQRSAYYKTRSLLRQGLNRRDITSDKKVVMAEELVSFEHVFGGAAEIEWALEKLDAEKEKSWNEYYESYAAASHTQQQAAAPAETVADVDMTDSGAAVSGEKRKNEEEEQQMRQTTGRTSDAHTESKKGRSGDNKPTRDRENCSVMIDSLPSDATQEDVLSLFKGCGEIREISGPKVVEAAQAGDTSSSSAAALVEFTSLESIPAARSRHLKSIRTNQVQISLGWQCTLYVINFAQDYDSDERMRPLFQPFGRIFDIRWPSKKFANSRRFCYVQYCNAESAASALALHEKEMENAETGETIKMQVFLSDPNRKKIRSDAHANERELFISGLPRGIAEDELASLFGPEVEKVRIPKHPDGRNKGIAFVDMKTAIDAQAALGRSREAEGGGVRIKGKLLTVSVADKGKGHGGGGSSSSSTLNVGEDWRSSSIRVRGLPEDAQEAIIQQLFEAQLGTGAVRRVNWTPGEAGKGSAIIELLDAATAGRAALLSSINYDDSHSLTISTLQSRGAAAPLSSRDSSAFAPRQAIRGARGRGRGGLGFGRKGGPQVEANNAASGVARGAEAMDVDTTALPAKKSQDAFRDMIR